MLVIHQTGVLLSLNSKQIQWSANLAYYRMTSKRESTFKKLSLFSFSKVLWLSIVLGVYMKTKIQQRKNSKRASKYLITLIISLILLSTLQMHHHLKAIEAGTEDPGVFRVGLEANSSPFNWSQSNAANSAIEITNSPGEYANGYDVWMADKIASSLDLKLEIIKLEWDGLIPALESGKIDAIVAGMSPTAERKKTIDFSDTYYTSDLVMLVQKGSPYENVNSIQDFKDAKVSAQINTFLYEALNQIQDLDPETALDAFPTLIASLLSGKLDAFVAERPGAIAATSANPSLTFVEFDTNNGFKTNAEETSVAIGLRKGSPLLNDINKALSGIPEDERQEAMEAMISYTVDTSDEKVGFWATIVNIFEEYWPLFLRGAGITLFIATLSTLVGFIIGLLVQIVREIPLDDKNNLTKALLAIVQFLMNAYVEIFRGTPMMVQAMLIFYGSKLFLNIDMTSIGAALLIVSINTGAYLSEVVKGGIRSISKGQFEACKSIGLNHWQSMIHVILPQTIKTIIPAIGNEFVANIKDSTVLNVISVTELFFVSKSVAGTNLKIFHTYLLTAIIYFVLTFAATRLINWIGKKTGQTKDFSLQSVST